MLQTQHSGPSYFYFPVVAGLIGYAVKTQKIRFDFNTLSLQDRIIGSIALSGGFNLALVASPIWMNALIYSPVGVVNCPTMFALCGFLILNSEQGNPIPAPGVFCTFGALFFGGLGLLAMYVYYGVFHSRCSCPVYDMEIMERVLITVLNLGIYKLAQKTIDNANEAKEKYSW